jgi:hypothetical protein
MQRSSLSRAALTLAAIGAVAFGARAEPQWKMAAPLPKAIGEIEAATTGGKIYVLSGLDNRPGAVTPTGYNWQFDPRDQCMDRAETHAGPGTSHHGRCGGRVSRDGRAQGIVKQRWERQDRVNDSGKGIR